MGTIKEIVRVSKSVIGQKEIEAVADVLQRGYLGMGQDVHLFEQELSDFIGNNRSVVCVNTGTAALQVALQACGIGPRDEVLVPSLTYIATFQAISATGATPVACDVSIETCTIDIEDALRRITPRARIILPVHYASGMGDLEQVYDLAREHDLRVVEDAAHAFGCVWQGERVGALSDVAVFSFDGIKNITSGEGGAVVTGNNDTAGHIQDARLLGVQKDSQKRYFGQRSWEFDVVHQGWRFHMSNIMAAIGRIQLKRFEEFASARVQLAKEYQKELKEVSGVRLLEIEYGDIVPHIFPIFIENEKRDVVRDALLVENIESGIHYKPNHLLSLYKTDCHLPVTEKLYQEMLTIPLHPEVSIAQQAKIIEIIKKKVQ